MKHRSDRNPTYEEMAQSFKSRVRGISFLTIFKIKNKLKIIIFFISFYRDNA